MHAACSRGVRRRSRAWRREGQAGTAGAWANADPGLHPTLARSHVSISRHWQQRPAAISQRQRETSDTLAPSMPTDSHHAVATGDLARAAVRSIRRP